MKAMTESQARRKASAADLVLFMFTPEGSWSGRFGAGYREKAEERAATKPGLWLVEEDDGLWVVLQPVKPRTPKDCEKWDYFTRSWA